MGSGKTTTDASVWLLGSGVDPDSIRWVRPSRAMDARGRHRLAFSAEPDIKHWIDGVEPEAGPRAPRTGLRSRLGAAEERYCAAVGRGLAATAKLAGLGAGGTPAELVKHSDPAG